MKQPQRSNVPSLVCVFAASATTGGAMYAFGMYGEALKQDLHLTQSQLNTISSAMFIAGLLSWIPGMMVDTLGTKFSLCLGGLSGAGSTLTYWILARQFVVMQAIVPALSVLGMLTCLSCAMIVGSVFKVVLLSCGPGTKGAAVGVAKAYVGLGAGTWLCIFQAIRRPNETPLDFLPMSAFFFLVAAFLPALVLLPTQAQVSKEQIINDTTPLHFRVLYTSLLLMGIVVIGSSVADLMEGQEEEVVLVEEQMAKPKYGRAALIVAIWLGPIVSLLFLPKDSSNDAAPGDEPIGKQQRRFSEDRDAMAEEHDPITDTLFLSSPVASSDNLLKAYSSSSELRRAWNFHQGSSENLRGLNGKTRGLADGYGISNSTTPGSLVGSRLIPPRSGEAEPTQIEPGECMEQKLLHEDTFLLADIENEGVCYTQPVIPPPPPPPTPMPKEHHYYDDHNYTLVQMLQTPSAWFMLWTCTILVGSGTLQTNNMGEMVASRGFPEHVAPACLALFSVAQATARVVTGAVSEAALNWKHHHCLCFIDYGVPRTFFLVIASFLAFVAHLVLSFGNMLPIFVIGSVLSGIAFGMVWPLMVLIVGEVFGLENHGANYMFYE
eukprot:scaffold1352_cov180-Amphora_coffeaeformis.AAC.9